MTTWHHWLSLLSIPCRYVRHQKAVNKMSFKSLRRFPKIPDLDTLSADPIIQVHNLSSNRHMKGKTHKGLLWPELHTRPRVNTAVMLLLVQGFWWVPTSFFPTRGKGSSSLLNLCFPLGSRSSLIIFLTLSPKTIKYWKHTYFSLFVKTIIFKIWILH